MRERMENVGQAIQHAMRAIEQANPSKLYGIFGDTQWSNKERLPHALLRDLIDHYSKLRLSNRAVFNRTSSETHTSTSSRSLRT